ncbi:MAG: hypothetical protein Q4P34_07680 [Tissierellia bacterium]|nr:hypothetical protein [Tissierellia bacterium]
MKLQVFEFIDDTLLQLKEKRSEIEYISEIIEKFFWDIFKDDEDFLNISKRVKSEESLKEKILRQNYFLRYRTPEMVIDKMADLIGLRIECRFIRDEANIYERLVEIFSERAEEGYYQSKYSKAIQLRIRESQPQKQHNGFEIYKIDGRYKSENFYYHFELQIKSFVNIFWGDIDHRILYKNFSYVVTEDFIREMMYSIKDNLEMVDTQLMVVYNHLYDIGEDDMEMTKTQFKKLISKLIHDIFLMRFKANTGIVLDFRKPIDLIVDYIFAKAYYSREFDDSEYFVNLMNKLNEISKKDLTFGDYIQLGPLNSMRGEFCETFGKGIESIMNLDLKWNLILSIIFELEGGDRSEEFVNFIEYIVFTIIYRVRTSVNKFEIGEKEAEEIINRLVEEVFTFICQEYNADFFSINNMRLLERLVTEIMEGIESPEDVNERMYRRFRSRLAKEADV